ncbi:DUF6867 family protein [Dongia deserti]|uniref:DUF6867 family protein n=1 Tax=Dongia deserti TaxID=2268030 RepID=UPI000E65BF99|nr:hypothetical protein [Dongia deserti]
MVAEINWWEFLGITVILFGGCAFMMGQAIADTWRPAWQNVPYSFLLGAGNHFIDCALFSSSWGNWVHYLTNVVVLMAIALFAHRVTLARKVVAQYPWIYERAGLLSWREKASA